MAGVLTARRTNVTGGGGTIKEERKLEFLHLCNQSPGQFDLPSSTTDKTTNKQQWLEMITEKG